MGTTKKKNTFTTLTMIVFIIMNFTLSMSGTLFNGILDKIAVDLNIPLSQTGYLSSFYAYGAGIGVPIFLILFRKFDRSILLKCMLLINIIVTTASIFSPNYTFLLLMRFCMGLAGNCYGVLATANIAALSPKEKVGSNLALLITGSASALMIGIPLTRTLVAMYSWQVIFITLVILMLCALIYFIFKLPSVQQTEKPLNLKAELQLIKEKRIKNVLISSIVTFIGYGAFYTYVTVYLVSLFPQFDSHMSMILALIGLSSFLGNLVGGFVCDKIGFAKALSMGTILQIVTAIGLLISQNNAIISLILVFLWMFNGWFIGLQINTGIAVVTQNRSSLILSLNSSGIQLGQALGASITSMVITNFSVAQSVWISLVTAIIVILFILMNKKAF